MKQKFYLISIIPNQQARLDLQELRRRLFHEFGLASAMAFEPVIPLAWFQGPIESGLYAGFSKGYGGGTSGKSVESVDSVVSGERGHRSGLSHRSELGNQEGWGCSDSFYSPNEPGSPDVADRPNDSDSPSSPDVADRPNDSDSPGDHRRPEKQPKEKPTKEKPRQGLPQVRVTEPQLHGDHLYLGVSFYPETLPQRLIEAAGATPNFQPVFYSPQSRFSPPFPSHNGIFLAALGETVKADKKNGVSTTFPKKPAAEEEEEKIIHQLKETISRQFPPDTLWSSMKVGMYSLSFSPAQEHKEHKGSSHSHIKNWWKCVEWQLEWKIQLQR